MNEKKSVSRSDRLRISRATFPWIEEHQPVKQWMNGIKANRTANRYAYHLMLLLKGIGKTPEQLLAETEADQKTVSIAVKGHIG